MDTKIVKKWVIFFAGILSAVIIADALSSLIIVNAGITGMFAFLLNFILYAVFFFSILYALEKIFHIEFFSIP